jgi:regulator of cell morphogenesis and NO signaling
MSTTINPERTVAELARSVPGAARVFETLGIDYCCRGKQTIREAASASRLSVEAVLGQLEAGAHGPRSAEHPEEPAALIAYIVQTHHVYTREALSRLDGLAQKVLRVHGREHPELQRVAMLVEQLYEELIPHMLKEENVLFPYVTDLARGTATPPPFGTVVNPVRMMHFEHERVGAMLEELEHVTGRYTPPAGACGSWGALYAGLKELQADVHVHVHLENHVLFPAALALERQLSSARCAYPAK